MNYIANKEIKEKGGKLWVFFANLIATFDKVNREKLSRIMEEKGISKILRTRIDEISKDTVVSCAKCMRSETDRVWKSSKKGKSHKKKEELKWRDDNIEEIKDLKYFG